MAGGMRGRRCAWQEVCVAGGVRGRGMCGRGHKWQGVRVCV